MGHKAKIDNVILKRIRQKQEREKRKYRTRVLRKRYLIVCEGEKTEPNYFEAFKLDLPKGVVTVDVIGAGDNTINIVQRAISERDSTNEKVKKGSLTTGYDSVWAVFDRDDFPPHNFNNAVFLAKQENIGCAYSNQAFELWYILHFNFHDVAHSREQYSGLLDNYLGHKYEKNDPEAYKELKEKGDQGLAIRWAKSISERYNGNNPANEDPCTKVFELVEELNQYKD